MLLFGMTDHHKLLRTLVGNSFAQHTVPADRCSFVDALDPDGSMQFAISVASAMSFLAAPIPQRTIEICGFEVP
jgi:hypothetical protein